MRLSPDAGVVFALFATYCESGADDFAGRSVAVNVRQPICMLLRPVLPLLAGLALLGPASALAAGPEPDVPPPAAALQPDPVPAQDHVQAPVRRPAPVQPAQRIVAAPTAAATSPTQAAKSPTPAKATSHRVKRHPVPVRSASVHTASVHQVVDVTPLNVDVPVGLGEVASSLRDESSALLAAIALLAAAGAAASGIALTLVWGREVAS
jgi:hypothetical protein